MITSFAFGLVSNALIFNFQFKKYFRLRGVILKSRISSQQFYLASIADTNAFSDPTSQWYWRPVAVYTAHGTLYRAMSSLNSQPEVYLVIFYIPGS